MGSSAKEDFVINLQATVREQEALIEALDAALLSKGITARPMPGPWLSCLTPQERALVGALYGAYPGCLTPHQLLDILPSPRSDPEDRQINIVSVLTSKVRKTFGKTAIENNRTIGFRLSPEFYESIPKQEIKLAA